MDEEEVDRSVQIWRNFVNIWKIWYKETGKNLSKMDLTTTEFTVMELHYEFVRKSLEGLSEAEMDEALGLLEKMKISICDTVHG